MKPNHLQVSKCFILCSHFHAVPSVWMFFFVLRTLRITMHVTPFVKSSPKWKGSVMCSPVCSFNFPLLLNISVFNNLSLCLSLLIYPELLKSRNSASVAQSWHRLWHTFSIPKNFCSLNRTRSFFQIVHIFCLILSLSFFLKLFLQLEDTGYFISFLTTYLIQVQMRGKLYWMT